MRRTTFPIDPHTGPAIKAARTKAGLSLRTLADRSEISHVHLHQIERLESNPSFYVVRNIARVLGVSLDSLASTTERIGEKS